MTITGTAASTRTLVGSTITNSSTVNGGGLALTITGNAVIDGDLSNITNLSISGTSSIGGNITTTGTQTYTGAVTITGTAATRTLTNTSSAITFSSTVDSTALAANSLTFGAGTGTATFTGAVGGASNGALGTITNASGQTLIFSDAVSATTIANYGTLLFNATAAKTISPAITDNGTTTVQVINSANSVAPGVITFSGNVAADTITIGNTTYAGLHKWCYQS